MASSSKKVPISSVIISSDNAMRSCNICKTPPMGRNEHIMHILGKKHVKNIKSKTLAMMLNDEAERSLHVSQYSANTTAEAIVNYFWKFGVRHVHYTKSYTFVEFDSAKGAKEAMKGKHELKGKKIVVAPKRRLSSAGDKNEEFKGLPLSTRMTDRLRRLNNPRDIEYLIPDLVHEIEVNDYRSRESIRGRMEMVLRQHFPAVRAYVFGSSANNLGFRGCDIDLFVELGYDPWASGIKSVSEKNAADTTWYIARLIKKERIGYQVQAVPRARVPIVKFREWNSGIFVDVSFKNGMPVYNTELICQYTQTHELVRPYLMVIRYWAKIQGIAGGGQPASLITNYAFTMMMLWYLMYRSPPIIPTVANLKNTSSGNNFNQNLVVDGWNCSFDKNVSYWRGRRHNVAVMELVQEFFRFFGEINCDKYVISPLSGTMVDRKAVKEKNFKELPGSFSTYITQKNELQIDTPICVQDPFDHSHNVTRGLREGPLKVFQYKCRRADKFCEEVLRGSLPLDALLTKIDITPETMVEIFPEDEEEEEKSADPDDSVEILDDSSTNLDTSANSSIAEVITLNDTIESDSMEEEVSVLSNAEKLVNKEKDQLLPVGNKSKSPPIITIELPPEEEALKFPLAFENVPQFSLHFDGTIDTQLTETASEKEVATAASNLVHFVLQESLLCKVEVIEAPINKSDKGKKRAASDTEADEPSKRIKGDHGASAGAANKYKRIAKYRCKMEHAFWVGRKKISKQVPPNVAETPLQHEKAITNVQQSSVCEEDSNGVILQCMVSIWQEVESPFNILVTAVSTSSAKDTKAHMFPMFSYFSSLVPSLLKKVTHYLEINHSKR